MLGRSAARCLFACTLGVPSVTAPQLLRLPAPLMMRAAVRGQCDQHGHLGPDRATDEYGRACRVTRAEPAKPSKSVLERPRACSRSSARSEHPPCRRSSEDPRHSPPGLSGWLPLLSILTRGLAIVRQPHAPTVPHVCGGVSADFQWLAGPPQGSERNQALSGQTDRKEIAASAANPRTTTLRSARFVPWVSCQSKSDPHGADFRPKKVRHSIVGFVGAYSSDGDGRLRLFRQGSHDSSDKDLTQIG
jgi:hypothetical protein